MDDYRTTKETYFTNKQKKKFFNKLNEFKSLLVETINAKDPRYLVIWPKTFSAALWKLLITVSRKNFIRHFFQINIFLNRISKKRASNETIFRDLSLKNAFHYLDVIWFFTEEYLNDGLEYLNISTLDKFTENDPISLVKLLFNQFEENFRSLRTKTLKLLPLSYFKLTLYSIFVRKNQNTLISKSASTRKLILVICESIFISNAYRRLTRFLPEIVVLRNILTTNDLAIISLNVIHFILTFCITKFEYFSILLFGNLHDIFIHKFIPLYKIKIIYKLRYNLRVFSYIFLSSKYIHMLSEKNLYGFKFLTFNSYLEAINPFSHFYDEKSIIKDLGNNEKFKEMMEKII
ncbi:hypothetical protein TUBRATIS_009360 [Tubulinosema ratisbonensis]|uniref:Uncharacterized protein n=1 Tax=Tubulinosema ratisbonensis TaxID=291195 RepID=A0A437AMV1_9MICR|nr:hypothetical protein TUBRATIS_009360 [Tubulinosema ratisbonensis]